jgi:hypothetical protein
MRPGRLVVVVLLLFAMGCHTNRSDPYPVTMALDRACGDLGRNITDWFDHHPVITATLVAVATAVVVVGVVALVIWAAGHDDGS